MVVDRWHIFQTNISTIRYPTRNCTEPFNVFIVATLMILLDKVSSTCRLFADDCILYRKIKSPENSMSLPNDLDLLSHWASTWQMNFNTSKCVMLRCSRSPMPIPYNYRFNDHMLDRYQRRTPIPGHYIA